ncbi:hypothetical protein DYL61_04855 [Pseudomonas nabeulensis]|uniref:Uncharacterized protein n=1 Tax=Pseudomonas nabeulensis TaxID=2293833 RepID=A0A4Z0B967_9PSED|nr:hypothetical protein DYL61_04855 [Pseudomonas nabeulensis]
MDKGVHRTLQIFHGGWQACIKGKSTKAVQARIACTKLAPPAPPLFRGVNRFSAAINTTGRCRQGFSASFSYLG